MTLKPDPMKKICTIVLFMLSISGMLIYPQIIKQSNLSKAGAAIDEPKKVLIHLMGWYGEGNSGNH